MAVRQEEGDEGVRSRVKKDMAGEGFRIKGENYLMIQFSIEMSRSVQQLQEV